MSPIKTISTVKYLRGINIAPVTPSPTVSTNTTGTSPKPKGSSKPVGKDELARAKRRIKLQRFLDDGRQTLGVMQIYAEDETTELFEMTSVELPYLGNQNSISCIPPGKYLVRSYYSSKYGKCFWVYSNEAGGWKKNSIAGNGYIRQAVLIHRAPNSSWLAGCIGPGDRYNPDTSNHEKKDNYATGWIVTGKQLV